MWVQRLLKMAKSLTAFKLELKTVFASGRYIVALLALLAHLGVSMVYAPWHHLVEHNSIHSAKPESISASNSSKPTKRCHCKHHSHCTPESTAQNSDDQPLSHDSEDNCLVCQVLAQLVATIDAPVLVGDMQFLEISAPIPAVKILDVDAITPTSRGPPAYTA
jgi:hypothetical protein